MLTAVGPHRRAALRPLGAGGHDRPRRRISADRQEPRALRDALARAVGDPALEIAYRVDEEWVDEAGQPVRLPVPEHSGDRVVTLVKDAGSPVAALVHDPTALRDTHLGAVGVRGCAAGAGQRAPPGRGRSAHPRGDGIAPRLVEAGDEQRRRSASSCEVAPSGCSPRCLPSWPPSPRAATGETAADIDGLVDELDAASADLTRFAQGVHPLALTEHGLAVALRDLADHAAVPVDVRRAVAAVPRAAGGAVFFLCSEALANVAKYAGATSASIEVRAGRPEPGRTRRGRRPRRRGPRARLRPAWTGGPRRGPGWPAHDPQPGRGRHPAGSRAADQDGTRRERHSHRRPLELVAGRSRVLARRCRHGRDRAARARAEPGRRRAVRPWRRSSRPPPCSSRRPWRPGARASSSPCSWPRRRSRGS